MFVFQGDILEDVIVTQREQKVGETGERVERRGEERQVKLEL